MLMKFPSTDFSFVNIPKDAYWIFLGVFVLFVALSSVILLYHWKKYRLYSPMTDNAPKIYMLGILILLLLASSFLYLYSPI